MILHVSSCRANRTQHVSRSWPEITDVNNISVRHRDLVKKKASNVNYISDNKLYYTRLSFATMSRSFEATKTMSLKVLYI
jgi:hypothetical protein